MRASPEALWEYVSNTNRFNRDTGVGATDKLKDWAQPNGRLKLTRRDFFGAQIEQRDEPFEWVRPFRFGNTRTFSGGFMQQIRTLATLTPRADGGTDLSYEVWVRPRGRIGALLAQIITFWGWKQRVDRVFRLYDQKAFEQDMMLYAAGNTDFTPGGEERLNKLTTTLLEGGANPEITAKLVEMMRGGDEMILVKIRPYALADTWEMDRRRVLEVCLWATRVGMLNLHWDVLCPLCRGTKQDALSLNDLRTNQHCDSCNIDFEVNFDRSVELTFRPNPAIRDVRDQGFCIAGPMATPHIVVQQLIASGESRDIQPVLQTGRHRIRTLGLRGGQSLRVEADGQAAWTVRATTAGWETDEPALSTTPTITLRNNTDAEQLFMLERMAWSDQAATAAEVTAMQVFRDLFANEALRPGDQISVGRLAILFTDLRGSTQMYREIGDAPAFGLVMSHFDVLRAAIDEENGAVVKTIGDAVMAVFRRPVGALRAMLHAQARLGQPDAGGRPLNLRAGIHAGPCITVTLNGRLDYFGTTVNFGARLEGQSTGQDVVISEAIYNDPEVQAWLSAEHIRAEPFTAQLKGFEDAITLWRVSLSTESLENLSLSNKETAIMP